MKLNNVHNIKGFTLVELLASVVVIGVTASLLLPALHTAKRKTKDVVCLSNQRNNAVNYQIAFTDVYPDYNARGNTQDALELHQRIMQTCSGKIIPDPDFKDVGLYIAQGMTCPYALGTGNKRALFQVVSDPNSSSKKRYLTMTYPSVFDHLEARRENEEGESLPAVFDLFNENLEYPGYTQVLKEMFPALKSPERSLPSFNNNILHPHKKETGSYMTFRDYSQRWVTRKEWQKMFQIVNVREVGQNQDTTE